MTTRLEVSATWKGKLAFDAKGHTAVVVPADYVKPLGDDKAPMPMELLLMSLAACSGGTVATLLARANIKPDKLEVRASGERREEHPTTFESIRLEFRVKGGNADRASVEKAIKMSEERFCPVWAMLKGAVPIVAGCLIEK
jgi:putative redox protein